MIFSSLFLPPTHSLIYIFTPLSIYLCIHTQVQFVFFFLMVLNHEDTLSCSCFSPIDGTFCVSWVL